MRYVDPNQSGSKVEFKAQYDNFIGGEWVAPVKGEYFENISPVDGKVFTKVPRSSVEDIELALDAAHKAKEQWNKSSPTTRSNLLLKIADRLEQNLEKLAVAETWDNGKPIRETLAADIPLAIDHFRYFAGCIRAQEGGISEIDEDTIAYHFHEPLGVVGQIIPWNFPILMATWKIAPALAAGCSIIIRPSSQTPGTAMVMVDCMRAGKLPAGTVSLLNGSTHHTYDPIMDSPVVRKVSLTGSTRVGQQMIRDAAKTVKKVSMELGGNAPAIIYDDADLELALNASVATKFANAGQVCVTADRFFVHESVHDAFVEGFVTRVKALKLGDGLEPSVDMGPLINSQRLQTVHDLVSEALTQGASLLAGGERAAEFNVGHFYLPTVLTEVRDEMRVFAEENFGPIAAISRFSTDEEVIQRANASEMGLSAYAFTRSATRARHTVASLKAGMVGINSYALAASEAPFGGTNYSGMGREGGAEGINDYLDTKLAQVVL